MMFKDVLNLISITTTVNAVGDSIEAESKKEVYADKQSIKRNEFYQAAATGLRPELMFIIRTIDYSQEPRLEYPVDSEKYYTIIRIYEKGEFIELISQGLVNNATT